MAFPHVACADRCRYVSIVKQLMILDLSDWGNLTKKGFVGTFIRFVDELEARINAFEMAYRMQSETPEAVDLSRETEATKSMYGLDQKETEG